VAKRVENGKKHRHRKGHGDDERQAQDEDFRDHRPGKPLAHQGTKLLGDLADQHEAGQGRQGKEERRHQLTQQVSVQQAHS
jgi:hypothetical protein